jgi:hypothetical protein
VKCARCGHQWRLEADDQEAEPLELEEQEPDQQAEAEGTAAFTGHRHGIVGDAGFRADAEPSEPAEEEPDERLARNAAFEARAQGADWNRGLEADAEADADAEDPDDAFDDTPQAGAWNAGREPFTAAISTLSEPRSADYGDLAESAADDDAATIAEKSWLEPDEQSAGIQQHSGFGEPPEPGADDRFETPQRGAFGARAIGEDTEDPADSAAEEGGSGWAARLMRPWRAKFGTPASEDAEAEDTESAIREALKAALAQPVGEAAPGHHFEDRFAGQRDERYDHEQRQAPYARDEQRGMLSHDFDADDRGGGARADGGASAIPFVRLGPDPDFYQEEEEDPPFRLTGKSAKTVIFGTPSREAEDEEDTDIEPEDAGEMDTFPRATAPQFIRSQAAAEAIDDRAAYEEEEPREDFDRLYNRQFQDNDEDYGPRGGFDDDIASLQADLERTDLTHYEHKHSFGGLAVVAAWAGFLSIVSGVVLAMVSFRQDIMVALPGTADLYRSLGFQIADHGVDFAKVNYRWTTADGKPMIEVTGEVVNVTDRPVRVPRVLVNVRDTVGTDAVKATASVPREELAPRESASFTLDFVSPPENVAQIELEFDHSR